MEQGPQNSAPHRVEAYLDQVLAPLARRLSPFHRDELRRELRTHLWERVGAYQELGMNEADAVTEALRQFGGAEDFLRQWQREWMKTTSRVTLPEVWQATRLALPLSVSALLLACLPVILLVCQLDFYGTGSWWYSHWQAFNQAWYLEIALLPAGFGLLLGRFIPRQAVLGVFGALSAEVVAARLIYALTSWLWPELDLYTPWGLLTSTLVLIWMPIACASAALTGWRMRRHRKVLA